jgi:hypothetical protein
MPDHAAQLLHALLVGGDLRPQVGDVLVHVARGILGAEEQCAVISASRKRPSSTSLKLSI